MAWINRLEFEKGWPKLPTPSDELSGLVPPVEADRRLGDPVAISSRKLCVGSAPILVLDDFELACDSA